MSGFSAPAIPPRFCLRHSGRKRQEPHTGSTLGVHTGYAAPVLPCTNHYQQHLQTPHEGQTWALAHVAGVKVKLTTPATESPGNLWHVLCTVAQSCPTLCDPRDCSPPGSSVHGDSPGQSTGVGCHALLQGIFLTQGSNPDLPYCRRILYHLSHQGSVHKTPIVFKTSELTYKGQL